MSLDHTIRAYFVTTDPNSGRNSSASNSFANALALLQNHIPEDNIRQIKPSECYPLISSGRLTKEDVFILDRFEGDCFKQLQQTKSLIVGPPCIISCLMKCEPVPLGLSPVFTTAMRDLQISATSITAAEKDRLRTLIVWMGGHYFQNFGRSITHLISNSIKSSKYEHATLNGIPVMHVDWVQNVWERSCVENVSATDSEFEKYRLPIFFGANITCTGLDTEKKDKVMRIVNENGGTYHRAFRSQLVDIVITEQSKTNSEKYKAALRFNKEILLPEWIFDSEKRGYALPTKGYVVRAVKEVSTPKKSNSTPGDQTQLSEISRISYVPGAGPRMGSDITSVDETMNSTAGSVGGSNNTFVPPNSNVTLRQSAKELLKKATTSNSGTIYRLVLEEISARQANKAGSFLDGCCIYLSGFKADEREKLNRILNAGGATRYDEPNDEITHIIVGQLNDAEFQNWQKQGLVSTVHIVRLDWLSESIKAGHIVNEAIHRVPLPTTREPDAPSPSSKRTLRSMNHSFKQPDKPIKKKLFAAKDSPASNLHNDSIAIAKPMANSTEILLNGEEENLIAQYSQENEANAGAPLPPTPKVQTPLASSTQVKNAITNAAPKTATAITTPVAAPPDISADLTGDKNSIDFNKTDLFQGATFFFYEDQFSEDYFSQMISECEAAHGNIVSQTFTDPVDYAIVSFERTLDPSTLPVKARHILTDLYVDNCVNLNELLPVEYFHRYIPHTADSKPLTGMVIVISIYSGLERDFINSIGLLLGATVNKVFSKKEKPLLVCSTAEGSKYEGAIKWGYPVVNSQWLVECAETGKKLPYADFLVGDSASDFPDSPALQERSMRAKLNSSKQMQVKTATPLPSIPMGMNDNEPIENNVISNADAMTAAAPAAPAAPEFTPLRNKRVSELVGTGATTRNTRSSPTSSGSSNTSDSSPRTPLNKVVCSSTNFEFLEGLLVTLDNDKTRTCMREVIDEMRRNQTPELERIRRQACTPINGKMRTPNGIPDFCLTPEYQKRLADDFERRWRLPTMKIKPNTPIDEIRRRVMRITCETLGIPYDTGDGDNDNVNADSHAQSKSEKSVQTKVRQQQKTTERKLASTKTPTGQVTRTPGANATSRLSIEVDATPVQRKSSGMMPGRSLFMHNNSASENTPQHTPLGNKSGNMSDAFVPNTQSPDGMGNRALLGKSTINFDKISFEDTVANATATNAASTSKWRPSVSSVEAAASATSSSVSSPEVKQIQEYLKNCESRRQSIKRTHSARENLDVYDMESEGQYVQPFESEQFGLGTEQMVGWRDPAEPNRRRSRMSPTIQHEGTPRFSISCNENIRQELIDKITHLGGEVCANLMSFDPESTHFVCERPNRGEKMLASIASGKWVLSIKYVDECYAKDVFIDEELFEWSNAKAINLPQLSADEQSIAMAAHRWRTQLHNKKTGAFSNFRVLLSLADCKADAIKTVLKAGGGSIVEAKSPFGMHNGAHMATHCFVDVKKAPLNATDYRFLKEHNVKIMSQMYINAYLMQGDAADHERFVLRM